MPNEDQDEDPRGIDPGLPEHVALGSPQVDVHGCRLALWNCLTAAAAVHFALFARPLVVTSGKDGVHTAGSKHGTGDALDLRTHDKIAEEQLLFLVALVHVAAKFHCAVYDERQRPAAGHFHVEYFGP